MPVTQYSSIKPGALVSIVLKADQRTGRQVQGTVSQLLTRHNHPRGIKVKLTDGRVGRVEKLVTSTQSRQYHTMTSNNPWADSESQGHPLNSPTSDQQQGAAQGYYQATQPQSQNPPQQQQYQQSYQPPQAPPPGIRRSDSDVVAQQGDRAEQVEHMQQYEAHAPQSEDDKMQAQLQKEFPNIDSSLIAAIYNERKTGGDLGEVREMLQELNAAS